MPLMDPLRRVKLCSNCLSLTMKALEPVSMMNSALSLSAMKSSGCCLRRKGFPDALVSVLPVLGVLEVGEEETLVLLLLESEELPFVSVLPVLSVEEEETLVSLLLESDELRFVSVWPVLGEEEETLVSVLLKFLTELPFVSVCPVLGEETLVSVCREFLTGAAFVSVLLSLLREGTVVSVSPLDLLGVVVVEWLGKALRILRSWVAVWRAVPRMKP